MLSDSHMAYDVLSEDDKLVVCDCYDMLCRKTNEGELLEMGTKRLIQMAIDAYNCFPDRDAAIAAKMRRGSFNGIPVEYINTYFAIRKAQYLYQENTRKDASDDGE